MIRILRKEMVIQYMKKSCMQSITSYFSAATTEKSTHRVPIVIVGAGPSGLMLSNLLSKYNTPSLVLEARPHEELFTHPQAHFLNTRTMEIMRNSLPKIYSKVIRSMPPVKEWRYFSFGYSASSSLSGCMARVVHPVDRPLDGSAEDANGILLPEGKITSDSILISENPLSACSVGHLAQHTFSKLLCESALKMKEGSRESFIDLMFNSPVSLIEWNEDEALHQLTTKSGKVIHAPIVIAADGSNSNVRKSWKIEWAPGSRDAIQHLLNIHIKTTSAIHPSAMLYAIYNEECVAMMVRHSAHEYVIQLPYFPPYQSIERNFTSERLHFMVSKILGESVNFHIQSIRTWKMSSCVAAQYVDPLSESGILIGDAAHIFPPAGGFGMNTGLQDAFALAWRLACWYHGNNKESKKDLLKKHLHRYQMERQEVALKNAALSLRNFYRVLEVSKAVYLNHQHPDLLIKILDKIPSSLASRQNIFHRLMKAALSPLSLLPDNKHPYTKHITSNLRSLLKKGQGLPLLFPKHEIGFAYNFELETGKLDDTGTTWRDDSKLIPPKVRTGFLLPHCLLEILSSDAITRYPNLQLMADGNSKKHFVSSSDLPSQVMETDGKPCYVILCADLTKLKAFEVNMKSTQSFNLSFVYVVSSDNLSSIYYTQPYLTVFEQKKQLLYKEKIIVVRPDSHVIHVGDADIEYLQMKIQRSSEGLI